MGPKVSGPLGHASSPPVDGAGGHVNKLAVLDAVPCRDDVLVRDDGAAAEVEAVDLDCHNEGELSLRGCL